MDDARNLWYSLPMSPRDSIALDFAVSIAQGFYFAMSRTDAVRFAEPAEIGYHMADAFLAERERQRAVAR